MRIAMIKSENSKNTGLTTPKDTMPGSLRTSMDFEFEMNDRKEVIRTEE